jgi:hypothetical protein
MFLTNFAVNHIAPEKTFALFDFERVEVNIPRTQAGAINTQVADSSSVDEDSPALASGGETHNTRGASRSTWDDDNVVKSSNVGSTRVK